jgi:hypothetical protein
VQREREEEQMLGICRERERGRTDRGQEERGFFFMNKQMLGIATVLPNALESTVGEHIREGKLL